MRIAGSLTALLIGGVLGAGTALAQGAGTALAQGAGPYQQLSPGNRMIAKSLFKAQADADTPTQWTLDRISTAKAEGSGWGQVFGQMQAEGLVSAKNLGQVISRYYQPSASGGTGPAYSRTVVITSGFNGNYLARPAGADGPRAATAGTRPGK